MIAFARSSSWRPLLKENTAGIVPLFWLATVWELPFAAIVARLTEERREEIPDYPQFQITAGVQ
jgi:hypothetical protein